MKTIAVALLLMACLAPQLLAGLKVGFSEVNITPELQEDRPIWIAGYGHGRRATSVHDPIMARCAVLSDGSTSFAIVGVDLVGLQLPQVDSIRRKLSGIDHLLVGSSHNHEGPDVIGIWGRTPVKRGVDEQYLSEIETKIAHCVTAAQQKLAAVDARFGTADDASLLGDSRLPKVYDPTLRVLRFDEPGSARPCGLVVQWNCHPEALGPTNTALTADFPAATVAELQRRYDCPVVYLTGAVGGLMAPPDERITNEAGEILKEGDFEYARLLGIAVGKLASKAVAVAEPIDLTPFSWNRQEVYLPVRNPYYRAAFTAGALQRDAFVDSGDPAVRGRPFRLADTFKKMAIRTEVNLLRLGALDLAGIPGEIYPELVYGKFQTPADPAADFPEAPLEPTVDGILTGRKWMLVGLANDEIGYIIPKRQWDNEKPFAYGREKSQYGEMNSCSPDVASIVMRSLQQAVDAAAKKPATVRLVSYNVWYGFTKAPRRKTGWLEWVDDQQADIVALQELNGYTPEKLREDAKHWGHDHSVLLKEDGFPTGLTSRSPITSVERISEGFHHGLLRCHSAGLIIYVIHFHPSDWQARIREARLLLADIAELPAEDQRRVVLIGDFNGFSPLDKTHLELGGELESFFAGLDRDGGKNLNAGKLDYRGIQIFQDAGYTDLVHEKLAPGASYPGSFPTRLRQGEDMGRDRRLDYVFAPQGLAARSTAARVVRDDATAILSDHYPVIVDFLLEK